VVVNGQFFCFLATMPRPLRIEFKGGIYHVINRGNYRSNVFATEDAKNALLTALDETATKLGWQIHAWVVMSNHFHIALQTPRGNLVEGMKHWQATFATRFNRLRQERGHIFQGRYKSLLVDPSSLGSLCHYIHLNPVRAGACSVAELKKSPWSSCREISRKSQRKRWLNPSAALNHAGQLADSPAGHRRYWRYLDLLNKDKETQRELKFSEMSKGWVLGTEKYKRKLLEHKLGDRKSRVDKASGLQSAQEAAWHTLSNKLLRRLKRSARDLGTAPKSADWKLAIAAAMKQQTTVSNRWLGDTLNMGSLHEVSRRVSAWIRQPDKDLLRRLQTPPKPKT